MKKFLHPLIFLLLLNVSSFAQTELFSDNFDSYSTDQKLAEQSSATEWTTWSGSPGSGEDAAITTAQAYSAPNSAKIVTNNDLVLDLGGKTTGRYQVKFRLFVESNKGAFFGFMQSFGGSNNEFGLSAYFKLDTGNVTVGSKEYEFDFDFDTWMLINVIVDLDDDFASMFIDGDEIVSWEWSGGNESLKTLDAIDFWGYTDENGCAYYLDDIVYNQLSNLDAPTNLSSSVSDDNISLSWDAPASGSPTGYSVLRNNVVIGETTNLSFNDNGVYPGTYAYSVRASYGEFGMSSATNEENVTVSGGVARKMVLYEIVTGTWCQYCPGAAMGVHDLLENNLDVAIVKYHGGDDYEFNDATERIDYYDAIYYPTSEVDGVYRNEGGSNTESLYSTYKPLYDQRIDVPSTHDIDIEITKTDATNYSATITVTEEYSYFNDNLVLHAALTESNIDDSWQNQSEVNFACRDMYPSFAGTALDFSSDNTQVVTFDFTLDASWVATNCELVAFVQYNTTKEVVQAIKTEITAPSVDISIPDESVDVKLDQDIVFTFSDPIRHLTDDTIEVVDTMIIFKKNDQNGEDVSFEATINEELNQITVSHDSLDQNTTYYLELSSSIENFYDLQVDEDLSITFTTESLATGIHDFKEIENLHVYPNPFMDKLNLTFQTHEYGTAVIEIYNQSGVLVKSKKQQSYIGKQNVQLNTEDLANGIYFLNVKINNKKVSRKIVLLR